MKKLFATLTALAFVLGLSAAGFAQTTVKEEVKPAVKTQTPGAASQVTPAAKDKSKTTKETKESKVKGKKPETLASKKDNGKKPVASAAETKKEESKTATK